MRGGLSLSRVAFASKDEAYVSLHRHIGYGTWYLREAIAERPEMGEVVRATTLELLPAVADSLKLPGGAQRRAVRRHVAEGGGDGA